MNKINNLNNIVDPTVVALQHPDDDLPNFLSQNDSWKSLNINIDSTSYYEGMSYNDFLKQYVNKEIFNNDLNRPVLETMLTYANYIFSRLKVLEDIGIYFEIFLAGGAVRDIVSGRTKLLKDFDFFVSFREHTLEKNISKSVFLSNPTIIELQSKYPEHIFFKCLKYYERGSFNLEKSNNMYREQFTDVPILEDVSTSEKKQNILNNIKMKVTSTNKKGVSWYINITLLADLLLQDLSSKLYSKVKSLSDLNDSNYVELLDTNAVVGIIKLNLFDMPCDIMFIEKSIHHFRNFDWEICKAGLILYSPKYPERYLNNDNKLVTSLGFKKQENKEPIIPIWDTLPLSAENCVSRFFSIGDFLKDIHKKEMTYKIEFRHPNLISDHIVKRKKRLKEKYPDYKINFNTVALYEMDKSKKEFFKDEIATIETIVEEAILEELISINVIHKKIKKF